jgi:hypothetical protein
LFPGIYPVRLSLLQDFTTHHLPTFADDMDTFLFHHSPVRSQHIPYDGSAVKLVPVYINKTAVIEKLLAAA